MKAQIKINTTAQDFIITLVKIEITGCMHAQLGGGGGVGGYSRFQVTGMIKWGQKSQHQKIPRASNKTPQTYLDQNPTPKSKISHPKDFFNHPFHLKPCPSSHTQGPTPSRTWQVRGPFSKSQVLARLAS